MREDNTSTFRLPMANIISSLHAWSISRSHFCLFRLVVENREIEMTNKPASICAGMDSRSFRSISIVNSCFSSRRDEFMPVIYVWNDYCNQRCNVLFIGDFWRENGELFYDCWSHPPVGFISCNGWMEVCLMLRIHFKLLVWWEWLLSKRLWGWVIIIFILIHANNSSWQIDILYSVMAEENT